MFIPCCVEDTRRRQRVRVLEVDLVLADRHFVISSKLGSGLSKPRANQNARDTNTRSVSLP